MKFKTKEEIIGCLYPLRGGLGNKSDPVIAYREITTVLDIENMAAYFISCFENRDSGVVIGYNEVNGFSRSKEESDLHFNAEPNVTYIVKEKI